MKEQLPDHFVYSSRVIEFVTVVAETCLLLEKASEQTPLGFVRQSVKLLSLLYSKTTLVEMQEMEMDETPERFVTEEDYLFVRQQVEQLLGKDDTYLDVFHPDMAYSDTPIAAFISENLADVYQELKDFAANYRTGEEKVMNDALYVCLETFAEHWGQKLLGALRALHAIRFNPDFELEFGNEEQTPLQEGTGINRNRFLDFQQEEEFF